MDYRTELIAFLRFITIYNHDATKATGNYPMSYNMILGNAERLLERIKSEEAVCITDTLPDEAFE